MKKSLFTVALSIIAIFSASNAVAAPFIVNSALSNIGTAFDNVIPAPVLQLLLLK